MLHYLFSISWLITIAGLTITMHRSQSTYVASDCILFTRFDLTCNACMYVLVNTGDGIFSIVNLKFTSLVWMKKSSQVNDVTLNPRWWIRCFMCTSPNIFLQGSPKLKCLFKFKFWVLIFP